MMSPEWAQDDDALLGVIREAARTDPGAEQIGVSDSMLMAANAAYTWRAVDQDLERLTVASDPAHRIEKQQGLALCLELEIDDQVIVGRLYPSHIGLITFMSAAGPAAETITDAVGSFTIDRPAGGPFRLRCDTANASVITEWAV